MTPQLLLLLSVLLLSACSKEPFYQEQGYVFGTLVEVSVYGVEDAQARSGVASVMQEFQRLHHMLHAWQPSELSDLNAAIAHGQSKRVSPELASILQEAARLSAQSDGLFNPALGGLIQIWGFQSDEFNATLPDELKIAHLLIANPQMNDLRIGKQEIRSRNRAVKLDLGGYAKGYALDRAAAILHQQGIHHALINIGGNVLALGRYGSRAWRIGIQHPRRPGPLAILELQDGEAIGTSGDYQRFFEIDGVRYSHLIDPRSGYPAQGVQAVTILTRGEHAGLLSDVASKPLFIADAQHWLGAAEKMMISEALLVDARGEVLLTAGMHKRLKFTDDKTVRRIVP